jgi:hypothetical protein
MKKTNGKNAQRLPTKNQRYAEKQRNSKIVKWVGKIIIAKKLEKHYT